MPRFIDHTIDNFKELTKKTGLRPEQDDISDVLIPRARGKKQERLSKKYVDNWNYYVTNQKRTNRCTAYQTASQLACYLIRAEEDKRIWFDPNEQWNNQLQYPGTASEDNGDYLQSAGKALEKFGLHWLKGTEEMIRFDIENYKYLPKDQWKQALIDGHVIHTGLLVTFPMVDGNYFWKSTTKGGGHAILITGFDESKQCFIAYNPSWGRWGEKKTGRFYIKYQDVNHLFRGWIIEL